MQIRFNDSENLYDIASIRVDENHGMITIVGDVPDDNGSGFKLIVSGTEVDYSKYNVPLISLEDGEVVYSHEDYDYLVDGGNAKREPQEGDLDASDNRTEYEIMAEKNAADIEYMAMMMEVDL